MARIDIRLSEEEKEAAKKQSEKLGMSISDYIRFIINIDAATEIIKKLKDTQ